MRAIGFSFRKINVEKLSSNSIEGVKVSANIDISEITSVKPSDMLKTKDELLVVKFTYIVSYDPDFAKLAFSGDIVLEIEPKISKDILKSWKENKEMTEDFRIFVFNIILRKSNLKALELEDEMNLPLHIPMPSVQKEDMKSVTNE
jgi:hypothetical protein